MSVLESMEEDDADLTVKTHLNGEDLARQLRSYDIWYDHEGPLTLILVHGFRTDENQAAKNYGHFKRQLSDIDPKLGQSTLTFSWPSQSRLLDGTQFFLAKDKVAHEAGRLLGDGLLRDIKRNRRSPRDYVLIAHSLGSRVVMEALRRVLDENPDAARQFRILLMAAAVPVEDYADDADYARIAKAIRSADVLHSTDDFVLKNIFPAGHLWRSDEAVGLRGQPVHPWDNDDGAFEPYDHDHYWQDVDGKVSQYIARRLGVAVTRDLDHTYLPKGGTLPSGIDA